MKRYYVGLDVHSQRSVFVIEDAKGQMVAEGKVPTTLVGLTQLQTTHHLPAGTPVGLETGTVAFFVARQLSALGLKPVVIDAQEVRRKAHRPTQKSDRRDARELCEGLRRGIYRALVHVPPPPCGPGTRNPLAPPSLCPPPNHRDQCRQALAARGGGRVPEPQFADGDGVGKTACHLDSSAGAPELYRAASR